MKVIGIVGRKKAGKTTIAVHLVKQLMRPGSPVYLYDVNNEYTRKFGLPNSYTGEINPTKFLDKVFHVKNSIIVFEEATSYFSNRGRDEKLMDLMTRCRHTNNVVILIFHSLADLPPSVYRQCEYICLFKTNDFRSSLDQKYRKSEQFLPIYDRIKTHHDEHYFEIFENLG